MTEIIITSSPFFYTKKIMKADDDVHMISAEAPVLFTKACEACDFFIPEFTIRSSLHAEESERRVLQKNDMAAAITRTDVFDFFALHCTLLRDQYGEEKGVLNHVGSRCSHTSHMTEIIITSSPLFYTKKIMKADEDVHMISTEAPVLFTKACEACDFFIPELTICSWLHVEESKRRVFQKNDMAAAITRTDMFDFFALHCTPLRDQGEGSGSWRYIRGDGDLGSPWTATATSR
ncbi:hypothetical protein ACFX10_017507 [Malus domestica]